MRPFKILLCSFVFIHTTSVHAQFYETGQTPINISWREINTEHFQIVYPESIKNEANKFTRLLETAYPHVSRSLGHKPGKIPVLLNNQSVNSNGLVVWAPKRMELVTTPPQNTYAQPWLQQLVLHEMRHVVQVDKLNKGLIKFLSYPLGQIASGGAAGFLPFWFLEGDAVVAETSLSEAGRGADPEFKMGFRTIALEKDEMYPYRKSYFGSFKDFIPNYYELGYLMTSYARIAYNPMVWDTVLNYIPKLPYTFFPFHFGLKQYDTNKKQLYQDAFDYYKTTWEKPDNKKKETELRLLSRADKKNDFIEYRSAQVIDDSTFVALKTSLNEIPGIYKISKNGEETRLFEPGLIRDFSMSYANGMITWAERVTDPFWSKKNYSVLKVLEMGSGKSSIVKKNTRFFSPDLTSDASKIAAIENTIDHQNYLVILNTKTGDVLQKIKTPENQTAQNPRWNNRDDKIVLTLLGNEGKSIAIYDLTTGTWKEILEPTFEIISKPIFYGEDHIIFNGTYRNIGNILAIEIASKKTYHVTNARFGAYDADVLANGNEIVFSNYTSQGYDLVISPVSIQPTTQINPDDNKHLPHDILREQENWTLYNENLDFGKYESQKYNRFFNLLNFHSWIPFYVDLDDLSVTDPPIYPGAQLFSQNLLNTALTSVGYSYRENEHFFNTSFTFKGMRPIFEFSLDYGGKIVPFGPRNVEPPEINQKYLTQHYRLYLPINLTQTKYFTNVVPSISLEHRRDIYFDFPVRRFQQGLTFFKTDLLFYRLLKTAHRDLHPKFGQIIQAQFYTNPVDRQNFGSMVRLFSTLYFPGLFNNHSFILQGNYQNQDVKNYFLPFGFSFPRGFEALRTNEIATFSADYAFPLLYPDLDVFGFLYFKRIRGKGFYDLMNINPILIENNQLVETGFTAYNSFGFELSTDFHLLNILFPLNVGYRAGYQPELNRTFGEMVFNLDISQF